MTLHDHKPLLLSCALILVGTATADDGAKRDDGAKQGDGAKKQDGYGEPAYKQKAKEGYERFEVTQESRAELVALFDKALGTCCATETCNEAGGCATETTDCADCATGECTDDHVEPSSTLVWAVSSNPEALAVVRPLIEQRFTAEGTLDGQRDLMLWMLSSCKGDEAVACGEKLFETSSKSFNESHLLSFAGRSKPMTQALAVLAEAGRVLPAAYFALEQNWKVKAGEKASEASQRAKGTLVKATTNKWLDARTTGQALVAGVVLEKLGEPEHLQRVMAQVRDSALYALDAGKLDAAVHMTLTAEYMTKSQKNGTPLGLSSVEREMQNHYLKRSQEVLTADQVFELIERLLPM